MICGINNGIINNTVINIDKFIKTINPNKIYLDVDGVIWHSCQAVCDIFNKYQNLFNNAIQGNEIMSWNFKELNSNFTDDDIESFFESIYFFDFVTWIDNVKESLYEYEDKIIIITKGSPKNIYYKMDIFNDYFAIPIIGLPFECSKGSIDMQNSLLIDDCTKNLKESNATYKIQFLEYNDGKNNIREWTKDWNGLKMYKW